MTTNRTGRPLTGDEYKKEITKVLAAIHDICGRNDIPYFISFGSMLGAVRHKGFIPWDDDIDICMKRDDYERFCEVLPRETNDYYVLSGETSPNYYFYFSRVCSRSAVLKLTGIMDVDDLGPFVDIFILDKTSEDLEEREKHIEDVVKLNHKIKYALPVKYFRTLPPKRRLKVMLNLPKRIGAMRAGGVEGIKKKRKELILKYHDSDSQLYTACFDRHPELFLFTESELSDLILCKFEDLEVYIPAAYDTLLTRRYGDYMTLPPVEQRVTQHHFVPVWK